MFLLNEYINTHILKYKQILPDSAIEFAASTYDFLFEIKN